jgi:hypothetical protein
VYSSLIKIIIYYYNSIKCSIQHRWENVTARNKTKVPRKENEKHKLEQHSNIQLLSILSRSPYAYKISWIPPPFTTLEEETEIHTTHKSHMAIDLNELSLEGPEDGVPDLNIVILFYPPQQHLFHSFDLNIPGDESDKWLSITTSS